MPSERRPNLVFILVDDMGYGDFSRMNGGLSQTPRLDALIDESLCLTQAYTASPVCNPSRATLLTGRYPHRTGSIDTLEWFGVERLSLEETTLADVLKQAGYTTGLVGKWHLGAYDPKYHPRRRGFDETVCFRGGMHDYYRWRIEWDESVRYGDGRYMTDVWTEEACGFIERHKKEPFFLHLTYNAPHAPLQCPEEDAAPFRESGHFTPEVSTLYGMLRRMDKGVERVLDTLRAHGLEEDTIVCFSSDNGPQFGGGLDRFNCGWHGAKGSVYEGGIRVPMLVRWPGGGIAKGTSDTFFHFADWFPTLLAMAGLEPPADGRPLDGVNALEALRGNPAETPPQRFWQWNRLTPAVTSNAAIRDGDWKLVRPTLREAGWCGPQIGDWLAVSMYGPEHFIHQGIFPCPQRPDPLPAPPLPELYNIREDPLERTDLADRHPERMTKMLADLERWFEEVEAERRAHPDAAG